LPEDRLVFLERKGHERSSEAVINTAMIQRFVADKIKEASARGHGFQPKTVQNSIRVLSKIFNTALDWQMLTRTPMIRIRLPRVERKEMDFLRPEEVRLLLEHTPDPFL
jgi:site-specific recombinase XerD